MPELPEVETTRRGIRPALRGRAVTGLVLREPRLRWPVDRRLERELPGQRVVDVRRRAKYLLIELERGTLIAHLGMSGSLRVLPADAPLLAHDHYDLLLDSGRCLRFNDPRRFGSLHWVTSDPDEHPLLAGLGPEPLDRGLTVDYLAAKARGRRVAIKQFLMDQRIVVGVGNIYASEALFRAGINPKRAAGRVARERLERLVAAVQAVLGEAIRQGGTTLRDYVSPDGTPGYFRQKLYVYERAGEPCRRCGTPIRQFTQGQRSTYFCPACQR
ncbi:MAG: bifunctional DNA-formamidopyrimidine glycosylase/DNA-(apurinic or apyrimidinic site) lyase [Gammaproteobacteria bacterium]|nr:bifunctional DNA-formamidopyrimidine glycosylase/DNA-(apurinic or apyrimidinic site) lyase [Gammaproteobacteria bacterium]